MNRATLYLVCLLVIMVSCPSFMEHSKAQEGTQTTSLYAEAFAYNEATGRYAVGYTDEDTTFVVRIYDALTEQILHTVDIPDPRLNRFFRQLYFGDFKFSPSGDRLALSLEGPDGGGFFIVDVATGQLVLQQPWASIWHITWSPDGEFLAGIYHYSITEVSDGWLGLWDTHTGQEINQHRISPSSFTLDWHPSDNRLVIADRHYVVVWDAENWQEVYRVPAAEDYEEYVYRVAWSPLGDAFASLTIAGDLSLWDGNTGELRRQIDAGPLGVGVVGMLWSQDGKFVGVTSDNKMLIWSADSGNLMFSFEHQEATQIYGATFLTDGDIIYLSGDSVELLELSSLDCTFVRIA